MTKVYESLSRAITGERLDMHTNRMDYLEALITDLIAVHHYEASDHHTIRSNAIRRLRRARQVFMTRQEPTGSPPDALAGLSGVVVAPTGPETPRGLPMAVTHYLVPERMYRDPMEAAQPQYTNNRVNVPNAETRAAIEEARSKYGSGLGVNKIPERY